jgi:hypothetical protein
MAVPATEKLQLAGSIEVSRVRIPLSPPNRINNLRDDKARSVGNKTNYCTLSAVPPLRIGGSWPALGRSGFYQMVTSTKRTSSGAHSIFATFLPFARNGMLGSHSNVSRCDHNRRQGGAIIRSKRTGRNAAIQRVSSAPQICFANLQEARFLDNDPEPWSEGPFVNNLCQQH